MYFEFLLSENVDLISYKNDSYMKFFDLNSYILRE